MTKTEPTLPRTFRPAPAPAVPSLRDEFRLEVEQRALDAAAAAVLRSGWQQVRLADLARETGISRATLHRRFGGKDGLAAALLTREGERVLLRIDGVLHDAPSWESGLSEALDIALRARDDHPLLAAVLDGRHGDTTLLPFLIAHGPIVADARTLLAAFLRVHRPKLTARYLEDVADTLVRAAMSHLVAPDADDAARERLHRLAGHLLTHPPSGAIRS
ncbi:TetR family transcriptional regulator [Actinomycetospora sp. TBRC 11914]|uniref:TetR family transcriptional regulator n=1 Tax=Actinomycetospora sp. TBRC 11914 TaxID=2729387 RepID=UPI00145D4337|nr:TetR family transcriptional regulator [Actinomycetospora sp. TBRC 11914]NMO92736.1 TetR/AcrR family transcriptional regulator [Actinomycetospora sp. TBRC 11914]